MPTETERQLEHRTCAFEVRSVGSGGTGAFSGLASGFLNIDSYGSIIDPGAFDETLGRFMDDGFITYEHRWSEPIGKPTNAKITPEGLVVEGEIYDDMFDGKSVLAGMRRGVIKQMSIGFFVDEEKFLSAEELAAYWQERGYKPCERDLAQGMAGARVLTKVTLEEAAICMRGANPAARVSGVRSMLRNLFGLGKRAEAPMPAEKPAEDPAESEDTVDEAEIDAIVARFVPALKSVVTEMAKERKGKTQDEPTTPPEDAKPPEEDGMDEEEARSALLLAEHLLTDIEVEAALKEGRS